MTKMESDEHLESSLDSPFNVRGPDQERSVVTGIFRAGVLKYVHVVK